MNETGNVPHEVIDEKIRVALKDDLSDIRFPEDVKVRMAQEVSAKVARQHIKEGVETKAARQLPRTRRPFRAVIAVAAVVAAMGIGTIAYASGALVSVQDAVDSLFGAGPAPTEIIDKIGRPIGAAQSQNGVTVSADAVIADGSNYAIVYSIRKDDGSAFEGLQENAEGALNVTCEGCFTDIDYPLDWIDSSAMGAYGSSYFFDVDPTDNAIQMVLLESIAGAPTELNGQTAHANFGDFMIFPNDDYEHPSVLAKGTWNLSFKIGVEDSSVELTSGCRFSTLAGEAVMDKLTISPIAVSMQYTLSPNGSVSSDDVKVFGDVASTGDLQIQMADGEVIHVDNPGGIGWSEQPDGRVLCDQNVFLPHIIDPDDVTGIIVGGTQFAEN